MTPERRQEEMEPLPVGELGRLEYDPVEDVLICHVCGGRYRNIAQHARLAHQLGADDYRKLAGLNRQTSLVTPTMRERLREVTAPLIARLRTEGKLRRWDEDPKRWRECKDAAVQAVREGLRDVAERTVAEEAAGRMGGLRDRGQEDKER